MADTQESIASQAANVTPWGAVANAAAKVVNNVVDNIFKAGQEKKKQVFKQNLALLTTEQNNNLQYALLNAHNDTDRMAILTNAVATIQQSKINSASSSQTKSIGLVLGAVLVLVIAMYIIGKF